MSRLKLSLISVCLGAFIFLSSCGTTVDKPSFDLEQKQASNIVTSEEKSEKASAKPDTLEKAESTPENDTDIGLNNIKIDSKEANLTDSQKAVIQYFDNDYLEIPNYEFLRRYPNVFQDSQVTIYGCVKKVISMDNDNYEVVIWLHVAPYGMAYDEEAYEEKYGGHYVILRGKTDPSSWYMENDVLMAYGRYSGIETIEIDGTSYTIPCVNAYHANYAYQYRAFIINDKFDYATIKPVAETIFGKDIEIREAVAEDFSEETAMMYEQTTGVFPYYTVELENQSNANFTKFLFSTEAGKIIDAKDPPFDAVTERYIEFSADFEHFFLFTYNTSLESLKLSYYDKDLHKVWGREFEETTNAIYDYTKNNIYIVVNNELYVINTQTGEDVFNPTYVGAKMAIRKFSDGIVMVSESKSDGIMKSTIDNNILWKANLSTDVYSVGGIQLVNDNLVIQYEDKNWSQHYMLIDYSTGEIIIDAESVG